MLKNLTIRTKMMLLLFMPVLGLIIVSGRDVHDKYVIMKDVKRSEELVGLSLRVGAVVHELQKERGLSSGFINSRGAIFGEELNRQRLAADGEFKQLDAYVAANPECAAIVKPSLDAAEAQRSGLREMRAQIDALKIEGKDSFAFYTGINGSFLDVVAAVARNTKDPDIMRAATAYFDFSMLKEDLGEERATLSGVIANNAFTDETLRRTLSILASQKVYLEGFRKFSSPASLAAYDAKARSEFKNAEDMRDAVLAKATTGGFEVTPEAWFEAITAKIDVVKGVEDVLAREILRQASELASGARLSLFTSGVSAIVIAVLTLVLSVVVMKPLGKLAAMLKEIAEGEGDLTLRLETTDGKDEVGEVSRWFNSFVENIQGIMAQVSATTAQVATASNQLHSTAEQIATAAEEVASQTTTAATASEEMSATSHDISHNCSLAAEVASQASRMANDGSVIVQQTLHGMEQIANRVRETAKTVESLGGRSDQIGAIVSTIEEIADQTNLLALNAAIEAARAGEMGRGFAVVADEVRALAERTARATREIGDMIKGIQADTEGAVRSMDSGVQVVELGMESSRRSGEALGQILEAISEVTMQMHQIATAAEEQTATTSEISSNINGITVVVQHTASGAHETADAASVLSRSAHELEMLVGRFKI